MTDGYKDTASIVEKVFTHLGIFEDYTGIPAWILVTLLVLEFIFFVYTVWKMRRMKWFDVLELLMFSYFGWWILITPTSKAWERRIIIGILIFCLIASIRLVTYIEATDFKKAFYVYIAVGSAAFIALGTRTHTPESRKGSEALAEAVTELAQSEDAVFYGNGWWQAPCISFLSNISFFDMKKGVDLEKSAYFVADTDWIIKSGENMDDIPYELSLFYEEPYTGQKLYRIVNKRK